MLDDHLDQIAPSDARDALVYALITGMFIAAYTLWDKQAVSHFRDRAAGFGLGRQRRPRNFSYALAVKYSDASRDEWHEHKYEAIAVPS